MKPRLVLTPEAETAPSTAELERTFTRFWAAYPKRTRRRETWAWWQAHPAEGHAQIDRLLAAIVATQATYRWRELRYVPDPIRWLRHARWEDELEGRETDRRRQERDAAERHERLFGWMDKRAKGGRDGRR